MTSLDFGIHFELSYSIYTSLKEVYHIIALESMYVPYTYMELSGSVSGICGARGPARLPRSLHEPHAASLGCESSPALNS